ncbi:MAG: FHA domain-containing protein [Pirellulales bacterium]
MDHRFVRIEPETIPMQTQVLNNPLVGTPYLISFSEQDAKSTKIPLDKFPFSIGRNESCDYMIDSGRVSREHVLVLKEGNQFLLRDLDSTNGTMVNGEPIHEHTLYDGDSISVADFEIDFHPGSAASSRATMTLQMDGPADSHSSVEVQFDSILDNLTGNIFGHALCSLLESGVHGFSSIENRVLHTECRLSDRIQMAHRISALDQTKRFGENKRIFIQPNTSEIGTGQLIDLVDYLHAHLEETQTLVISIPSEAVSEIPAFREFMAKLNSFGCEIAVSNFSLSSPVLTEQSEIVPNYIEFSPAELEGLISDAGTQEYVVELTQDCAAAGISTIASEANSSVESELYKELGINFSRRRPK